LSCDGAKFLAQKGHAHNAQGLICKQQCFWAAAIGAGSLVDYSNAHLGVLCDELASWPEAGKLSLDHFTYDQIGAG
jgi:hypothetical protein